MIFVNKKRLPLSFEGKKIVYEHVWLLQFVLDTRNLNNLTSCLYSTYKLQIKLRYFDLKQFKFTTLQVQEWKPSRVRKKNSKCSYICFAWKKFCVWIHNIHSYSKSSRHFWVRVVFFLHGIITPSMECDGWHSVITFSYII